ncbi:MAG: site-2 protease family protein [Gammaproteobacteria bacterium]|nr:site-2 protease family protein [Gammaproteobacteria bacterium]
MSETLIQTLAVVALPLLFAITVHEVGHGWMANRLGDPTAKMLGRLTLNPLKHIDPIGTVVFPVAMLLMSSLAGGAPFLFGWAKPVPITVENLKGGRRDMALVAVAGPATNLIMALIWAGIGSLVAHLYGGGDAGFATPLLYMAGYGIFINMVLMVLNLLPIPPLDGGRILESLLPGPLAWKLSRLEPYGMYIILAMILMGGWELFMQPLISTFTGVILAIFGMNS